MLLGLPTANPPIDLLRRILRRAYLNLARLGWRTLVTLATLHACISWIGLWWFNDHDLLEVNIFLYFWATTGTTVGYGDFSPTTVGGRYFTVLWIMPGGISLFSTLIAKIATDLANAWRSAMHGTNDYDDYSGHIVILGFQPDRTAKIINLLRLDKSEKRKIILVARNQQHPLAELEIDFVHTTQLTDEAALRRAAVDKASLLLIYGKDDSDSLGAALSASALNETAHLVVYFSDPAVGHVLQLHCPQAEVIATVTVENMVRAAQDPGSFKLVTQILSGESAQTQFSTIVPQKCPRLQYGDLLIGFKQRFDAALVGIRNAQNHQLNPPWETVLQPGDQLYYIASHRLPIKDSDWKQFLAH